MIFKKHKKIIALFVLLFVFYAYAIINGSFSIYRELKQGMANLNIISPSGTVTVNFDANGGTIDPSEASRSVTSGTAVGTLPTTMTRTDYNFLGWYTHPTDGVQIDSQTTVTGPGPVYYYAHWVKILCKKAVTGTLHSEKCLTGGGCLSAGYRVNDDITYGEIPVYDTPEIGYAYDCDVNNDGVWDDETERFYYVRSLGGTSGTENSVLVHYTSFDEDGQMDSSDQRKIYTYAAGKAYLPDSTTWSHPSLTTFDGKVSRYINADDLTAACGTIVTDTVSYMYTCQFYLETSKFQSSSAGRSGIWVDQINSTNHRIDTRDGKLAVVASDSSNAVRPTIQIPSNTIEDFEPPVFYTIGFDANTGTMDPADESRSVRAGRAIGDLPTATKAHNTLDGWYTASSGGTKISASTLATGNDTYYAHWIPNVTVNFNANGGSVSPASKEFATGTAIGELPIPTYRLHTFIGWYTEAEGGTVVTDNTVFNANDTIYAHWDEHDPMEYVFYIPGECTFTGSAITDGNNGDCVSTVNPTGSDIDYTETTLSQMGYIDTDVALYGDTYHDRDYEVGFTIVDYTNTGQVYRSTIFSSKAEISNRFPGVTFRRNDSTSNFLLQARRVQNANSEITIPTADVQSVVIYRESGSIYYSINGGTKTKLTDVEYNPVFDLDTWFGAAPTDEQASGAQRLFKGTLSNIYIKVQSEASMKAQITFDPNYEGAVTYDELVNKGQAIGTLTPATRTGYTFLGWFTDPSGGTEVTSSTVITADIRVYAHWHEDVTVTLHTDGGTIEYNTITVHYNSAVGTIPTPTKTGNTFAGWYQDENLTVPATSETIITQDTDFYAKWLPDVTVTLHPNNGTVSPTEIVVGQGSAVGELPTPIRTGYTFAGWYQDEQLTTPATSATVINSNTDFYAKWLENITITFNPKGGSVDPTTVTFPSGSAIGDLPVPTNPGYGFDGWYIDDESFQNRVTSATTFNSTTQIYAKWLLLPDITITFDADGGTANPNTVTMRPGFAIGELPTISNTPDQTSSNFVGWFIDDNTYTTEVTEDTIFDEDTDVIAKWVDSSYVACIGSTCYKTLALATEAVPNTGEKTVIKIIANITTTSTATIADGKNVELDVQNFTVGTTSAALIQNNGTLHIKNGTLTSTTSNPVIDNKSTGVLNISGGLLRNSNQNDIVNVGTVNITGGRLEATGVGAAINNNTGGILNVSAGEIVGTGTTKCQAIYNDGGTTTISGTAYLENNSQNTDKNGRAAMHNNAGTVNILGGTIISKKNSAVKNNGTMTIGTDDGTIDITSPSIRGYRYGLEILSGKTVTIYDGIFKGDASINNKAINDETATVIIDTVSYAVAYLEDTTITITVNFNKNGGDTVEYNSKTLNEEGPIGTLPAATKANKEFLGWFTAATGGERVLPETEVTATDDGTTYYAHYTNAVTVCRPATVLHSSGGTNFGQIHSGSTLSAGDAFDCDVNGDGTFDATNERFYYLTDTANGDAVFIFSNNTSIVSSAATPICSASAIAYGTLAEGPNTAIGELPTTTDWPNVNLYTEPRDITNEANTTIVNDYLYAGKAARFATLDEIKAATSSSINGTVDELASYTFLLENTASYGTGCRSNYWIETQNSNGGAFRIDGATSNGKKLGSSSNNSGVRPVIEVPYESIDGVVNIVEFDTIPTAMRVYFNNVSSWNSGQDDTNYSSFNSAMTNNLNNYNCVYYENDNTNTEYGSVYCDQPNKYDTGITGNINVYEYNETTGTTSVNQASYVSNDNGKLYNFIPGKTYYWVSATDQTKYGYVRPTGERRLITINGTNRQTRNVRDLGGLPVDTNGDGTIDGTIKYQKLYRGEKIWGTNRNGVTRTEFEKLGIYNELDLRTQGSEIVASEEDQLTNYTPYEIVHYKIDHTEFGSAATEPRFNGKSYYQLARDSAIEVMQQIVANNDDYAIYFHCRIGADRTGTLAYILEGLLGVPTEYRHQDYELTTFFGLRERTRYYYKKDSTNDAYKFIYLKKAIRHATPNNNENTGEENVMDWFLLEGNTTTECNDITALINQFRTKMIDYYQ